jgi:hypothetical protein
MGVEANLSGDPIAFWAKEIEGGRAGGIQLLGGSI